ncbi:hypothetical protein M405DRAFT_837050 [Rhizopogon salebrosus TDB-379]|nr:hypothetical protein M405DRAFT_837050 [Rhizopogon salebrosus TDB-379]
MTSAIVPGAIVASPIIPCRHCFVTDSISSSNWGWWDSALQSAYDLTLRLRWCLQLQTGIIIKDRLSKALFLEVIIRPPLKFKRIAVSVVDMFMSYPYYSWLYKDGLIMGEGELTTVYHWKRLNGCTDNQYRDTDREATLVLQWGFCWYSHLEIVQWLAWEFCEYFLIESPNCLTRLPAASMTAYAAIAARINEDVTTHIISIVTAEGLLIIRTYAFWGRNKKFLAFLLVVATHHTSYPPTSNCTFEAGRSSAIQYGFLVAFELMLISLTVYKRYQDYRDSDSRIMKVVCVTLFQMIFADAGKASYDEMMDVMLASRILFGLHQSDQEEMEGTLVPPVSTFRPA